MSFLSSVLSTGIGWVLPSRCPLCGLIVVEDHQFCLPCWQKLKFISEPWCASCGLPFAFDRPADLVCAKCLRSPPNHDGVRAVTVYDDNSGQIAMGLKYATRLGLAMLIAKHLEKYLDEFGNEAMLVPIPLHRSRLWSRGFNQSVLIGNALSRRSGLTLHNNILVRRIATPPLRSMTAKERRKLVGNAISLSQNAEDQVAERTILLIDDVYTTGATTNACAKLLKSVGAKKVFVLCWARATSDSERF